VVERDPGDARLPRQAVVAVRVPGRMPLYRLEVLDVRDGALVELLDPLLPDQQRGVARVVGHDDDVPADRLSAPELRLDLAEELFVAVDVLGVGDVDARLLLELVKGRMPLPLEVHVVGPVREVQRLRELVVRAARAGLRGRPSARRQDARETDRGPSHCCAFEQLPPGEVIGHSTSSVESTTNVESGLHEISLGAWLRAPGSLFWTYTLTLPALVSSTYCVATPTYAVSSRRPVRRFSSAWPSRIFSGRTPTATRPVRPFRASPGTRTSVPSSRRTVSAPVTVPMRRLE